MDDPVLYFGDGGLPPEVAAQRFENFHAANPHVYTALVALARRLKNRGHQRIGMGMLFEVLRWQWMMGTDDPHSEYRLNNNYRSRYARLIMQQEPDLADVFETRRLGVGG